MNFYAGYQTAQVAYRGQVRPKPPRPKRPRADRADCAYIDSPTEKRCSKCGEVKPVGEFHCNRARRDGLSEQCKRCRVAYQAAYTATHREEANARSAAYYRAHREEAKARGASYRAAHREEQAAYLAAWRDANRDKIAADGAARRRADLAYINSLKVDGCVDCGAKPDDLSKLHWHHLDPAMKVQKVAAMPSSSRETIAAEIAKCVLVCEPCHKKRHKLMREAELCAA